MEIHLNYTMCAEFQLIDLQTNLLIFRYYIISNEMHSVLTLLQRDIYYT